MSALEPPVPEAAAEDFTVPKIHGDPALLDETGIVQRKPSSGANGRFGKWRRAVGLILLFLTVFLWTASNFLASTIFADNTYSKPYFVTYTNTAFFILPLIPILLRKAYRHPEELKQWRAEWRDRFRGRYSVLKDEADADGFPEARPSLSASQELILRDSIEPGRASSTRSYNDTLPPTDQLTLFETAQLSIEFCMLWFLANYFVAACLEYTTVASSTILTSTSSVFTLLFGALFRVERFTLRKLIGVLASLTGIVLISSMDLSGDTNDEDHRGDFPQKSLRETAIGDALAFLSAVMYGIYAVFMKKRIGDESRVNMPLFFGLVGLINVLMMWPGFFIFHFTGVEKFELPPSRRVTLIILCNSTASLVSDIAWAYAVLLTSPIVVTVGLSMTIPLSLVGQIVLNGQTASPLYWVGATVVVLSFLFVIQEEKNDGNGPAAEGDGSLDARH